MPIFNESIWDTLALADVVNPPAPRQVRTLTVDKQWLSQLIYALKTNRPTRADWYRVIQHYVDLETGEKVTEVRKLRLKRAVVLPMSLERKSWNLSQLPEFQNKGLVERQVATILIDAARDTPIAWVPPTTEDWFIFWDRRWDVLLSTNYANRVYSVICAETVGQEMERIEEAHNGVALEDTVIGVL